MSRPRVVALLALMMAVAACGSPTASTLPTLAAFSTNRAKFTAGAGKDYSYVVEHSCFCIEDERQPVRVTVRNGVVVSAVSLDSGADVTARGFRTVPEFFDYVEHAVAERRAGRFDEVRVSFDKQYGFPDDIWVDESYKTADEEQGYTLSDLRPIP